MNNKLNGKVVLRVLLNLVIIAVGIYFVMNAATDIQLGSGAILLAIGFNGVLSAEDGRRA